jgi:DNA-binding MarR family transcriptional regulator
MPKLAPFESLGFHCALTFKAFVAVLEDKLKGSGVPQAQFLALAHLTALGPLSQSELATRLSIMGATAAKLIDRMERDGWAEHRPDPQDGRVKLVTPTEQTARAWEQVSLVGRRLLEQAYRGAIPRKSRRSSGAWLTSGATLGPDYFTRLLSIPNK